MDDRQRTHRPPLRTYSRKRLAPIPLRGDQFLPSSDQCQTQKTTPEPNKRAKDAADDRPLQSKSRAKSHFGKKRTHLDVPNTADEKEDPWSPAVKRKRRLPVNELFLLPTSQVPNSSPTLEENEHVQPQEQVEDDEAVACTSPHSVSSSSSLSPSPSLSLGPSSIQRDSAKAQKTPEAATRRRRITRIAARPKPEYQARPTPVKSAQQRRERAKALLQSVSKRSRGKTKTVRPSSHQSFEAAQGRDGFSELDLQGDGRQQLDHVPRLRMPARKGVRSKSVYSASKARRMEANTAPGCFMRALELRPGLLPDVEFAKQAIRGEEKCDEETERDRDGDGQGGGETILDLTPYVHYFVNHAQGIGPTTAYDDQYEVEQTCDEALDQHDDSDLLDLNQAEAQRRRLKILASLRDRDGHIRSDAYTSPEPEVFRSTIEYASIPTLSIDVEKALQRQRSRPLPPSSNSIFGLTVPREADVSGIPPSDHGGIRKDPRGDGWEKEWQGERGREERRKGTRTAKGKEGVGLRTLRRGVTDLLSSISAPAPSPSSSSRSSRSSSSSSSASLSQPPSSSCSSPYYRRATGSELKDQDPNVRAEHFRAVVWDQQKEGGEVEGSADEFRERGDGALHQDCPGDGDGDKNEAWAGDEDVDADVDVESEALFEDWIGW